MARIKRRKKFIDPKVQGALVKRISMHYLVFFVTACAFGFCLQFLSNPFMSLKDHFRQLWVTEGPFILTVLCLLPIFVRDTVTLSHRFVGPVLRVRNTMRQASRGEKTARVTLRPDDFWMELADDLNELLDHIESGKQDLQEEELVKV